jgi:hypothetical protein
MLPGGRSANSASREMIKQLFGVCLVSIIEEHQRDERELSGRKRIRVNYDDSSRCANLIEVEQLNKFGEFVSPLRHHTYSLVLSKLVSWLITTSGNSTKTTRANGAGNAQHQTVKKSAHLPRGTRTARTALPTPNVTAIKELKRIAESVYLVRL